MLRSDIDAALASFPNSNIKTAALEALDKTPVHLDKDSQSILTQKEVEHIVGVVLGKPLQRSLEDDSSSEKKSAPVQESGSSISRTLGREFGRLFSVIDELIQQDLFNRQILLLIWNRIHENINPISEEMFYSAAVPVDFLKENQAFVNANPGLLEAMVEISATQWLAFMSEPSFREQMKSVIQRFPLANDARTSEFKTLESKTDEAKTSKTKELESTQNKKLSKLEFQIILLLAQNDIDGDEVDDFLNLFQNATIYRDYIPALALQNVKKWGYIASFSYYLKKLKEINFLNEITANAAMHIILTTDDVIAIFVLLKNENLLSLESINIDKRYLPTETKNEREFSLELTSHLLQPFILAEAATLASVNKRFNQLFQPPLTQRKNHLAKIDLLIAYCGPDTIDQLKQILIAWKQRRLLNEKNFNLLFDYIPILRRDASFLMEASVDAPTKKGIAQLFQKYKVDNFIIQIRGVLDSLDDKDGYFLDITTFYKNWHELFIRPTFSLPQNTLKNTANNADFLQQELAQLKKRSDISADDYQNILNKLLHKLLFLQNAAFIEILLANGADIRHIEDGHTIWHSVAGNVRTPEIAQLLLTTANKLNPQHDEKEIPLEARLLNERGKKGERPLHVAIQRLNIPMVQFLVDKKADVQVQDEKGNYPIHFLRLADAHQIMRMVNILLTVDPKTLYRRNSANRTILHLSIAHRYHPNFSAAFLFIEKYNVSLYPKNGESIVDDLLKAPESVAKKNAICVLLFNYLNKLTAADREKLWKSIDVDHLTEVVASEFDLITRLHVAFMLAIQKPVVGVNYEALNRALLTSLEGDVRNYLRGIILVPYQFYTPNDYDARQTLAASIPVNVFIFNVTERGSVTHTEHKAESKDDTQNASHNILVTIWKKMKELIVNKETSLSGQLLCLHLLNIVNALETRDYVKTLRAILDAVYDFNQGKTLRDILGEVYDSNQSDLSYGIEKIVSELAELLPSLNPQSPETRNLMWIDKYFSGDKNLFFENIFSSKHRQFHEFLSQNLNDREAFCAVFMKLGFTPSATSRSDSNTIGKWIHEKQAALRFSISRGLQRQSLMPRVVPDQRTDGIEMLPVSEFKKIQKTPRC